MCVHPWWFCFWLFHGIFTHPWHPVQGLTQPVCLLSWPCDGTRGHTHTHTHAQTDPAARCSQETVSRRLVSFAGLTDRHFILFYYRSQTKHTAGLTYAACVCVCARARLYISFDSEQFVCMCVVSIIRPFWVSGPPVITVTWCSYWLPSVTVTEKQPLFWMTHRMVTLFHLKGI